MPNRIVIDIGNTFISVGVFEDDALLDRDKFIPKSIEKIQDFVQKHLPASILIASVNRSHLAPLVQYLEEKKTPYHLLSDLLSKQVVPLVFDLEEPSKMGEDRIANIFGALKVFPLSPAIVIGLGTAFTFDLVSPQGVCHGGAIMPGLQLQANALHSYTDLLPQVTPELPEDCLGKATVPQIQTGLFYGALGAIERIVSEMKMTTASASSIKVIATGGMTETHRESPLISKFTEQLQDFVDLVYPHLSLVGLNEILKEYTRKTNKENPHEHC